MNGKQAGIILATGVTLSTVMGSCAYGVSKPEHEAVNVPSELRSINKYAANLGDIAVNANALSPACKPFANTFEATVVTTRHLNSNQPNTREVTYYLPSARDFSSERTDNVSWQVRQDKKIENFHKTLTFTWAILGFAAGTGAASWIFIDENRKRRAEASKPAIVSQPTSA